MEKQKLKSQLVKWALREVRGQVNKGRMAFRNPEAKKNTVGPMSQPEPFEAEAVADRVGPNMPQPPSSVIILPT